MESQTKSREIARNEPCPCGSRKKYKRCCGVAAAPVVTPPAQRASGAEAAGLPAGFDPSQMDPEMMASFAKAMKRLPRGQLQRLQTLVQQAMNGKDVSKEMAELERMLPPDFKALMSGFQMPGMMGAAHAGSSADEMSADEARKIVEQAMKSGSISAEKGKELLEASPAEKKSGITGLWKKVTGK